MENEIFQWYIITAVSGKEQLVVENLWKKIRTYGFNDKVKEIKIVNELVNKVDVFKPEEAPKRMITNDKIKWEVIKENGSTLYKKTKAEIKNKYPGYIFINMVLIEELWFLIRNTELVMGIVGSSGNNSKPTPIGDIEIDQLFQTNLEQQENNEFKENENDFVELTEEEINDSEKQISYYAHFNIGDKIKITSGALANTIGLVVDINESKGVANITFEMLGEERIIENISFDDIEVIE